MSRHFLVLLLMLVVLGGCYGQFEPGTLGTGPIDTPSASPPSDSTNEEPEPVIVAKDPPSQEDVVRASLGPDLPEEAIQTMISRLAALTMPVEGARVTTIEGQLPGAPRAYRNGIHQGLDFYDGSSGITITIGTPVLASQDGVIVRADEDFVEMTQKERDAYLEEAASAPSTPDHILDRLHGRQIWIEHEGGIITRYSHLDSLAEGITVGTQVQAGQVIGAVGNSGTSDGVKETLEGAHLHFEIIVDSQIFFEGMSSAQVQRVLREALE